MATLLRDSCPAPKWHKRVECHGGNTLTGQNRRARRETSPSANLFTTEPTQRDPGTNPSLRSERVASNRLSHGTAWCVACEPGCADFSCTGCVSVPGCNHKKSYEKWAKPGSNKIQCNKFITDRRPAGHDPLSVLWTLNNDSHGLAANTNASFKKFVDRFRNFFDVLAV
jgi:hypothetical protein